MKHNDRDIHPHTRKASQHNMGATSQRRPVTVRITPEHHQQLRQMAEQQDSTVSRLVARAVADRLDAINNPATTPTPAQTSQTSTDRSSMVKRELGTAVPLDAETGR